MSLDRPGEDVRLIRQLEALSPYQLIIVGSTGVPAGDCHMSENEGPPMPRTDGPVADRRDNIGYTRDTMQRTTPVVNQTLLNVSSLGSVGEYSNER